MKYVCLGLILLLPVLMGAGCGNDDPPNGPVVFNRVKALNGRIYKRDVGQGTLSDPLEFSVTDAQDKPIIGAWVHFTLLEGDGILSADSIATGSNGKAVLDFTFTDSLGYAKLEASSAGKTPVEVMVRDSRLVFGVGGQGQFVILGDTYATVKALNGLPASIDLPPFWVTVANYEAELGVVLIIEDLDSNSMAGDNEPVIEIIVNDNEDDPPDPSNDYTGTNRDGLGIGSTIGDFKAALGAPFDPLGTPSIDEPPFYRRFEWPALGLIVYSTYTDNPALIDQMDAREIHIQPMP